MTRPSVERLLEIYRDTKVIATVGASQDDSKQAHRIPAYLQSQGYRIIPVSPKGGELFGEKVYASLRDVDVPVDVVQVFRPSEETPPIAEDAVAIGAKVLWLQSTISNDDAARIAREGGLEVVMDRCMGATHRDLGLGPGPG